MVKKKGRGLRSDPCLFFIKKCEEETCEMRRITERPALIGEAISRPPSRARGLGQRAHGIRTYKLPVGESNRILTFGQIPEAYL